MKQFNMFSQRNWVFAKKLWFSSPFIVQTKCRRPWIFQTMNYVSSTNPSLNYQMCTTSGRWDIGIRNLKFVAKTQFLCLKLFNSLSVNIFWKFGIGRHYFIYSILWCSKRYSCSLEINILSKRVSNCNSKALSDAQWLLLLAH